MLYIYRTSNYTFSFDHKTPQERHITKRSLYYPNGLTRTAMAVNAEKNESLLLIHFIDCFIGRTRLAQS